MEADAIDCVLLDNYVNDWPKKRHIFSAVEEKPEVDLQVQSICHDVVIPNGLLNKVLMS